MLRRLGIVVMLFAVVGAACGGGDSNDASGDGSSKGGSVKSQPLEGTTWALDQKASTHETIAPEVIVTARFSQGALSGSSGCSSYRASYTVSGSKMTVKPGIAATLIACPPPASNVETAYLERLPQVQSYAIDGDRLTLTTSTKGADLVYRAPRPGEALAGDWEVTSYFRPGAIVSVILGTTITATFRDGTLSGNGGCNTYSGTYKVDGSSITIGPIASTRRACADAAVTQQEADYFAALELARAYEVTSRGLTLFRDGGTIAVTYARG